MKIKPILYVLLVSVLVFFCQGGALAFLSSGNPDDTPAGTFISFEGSNATLDFDNVNATAEATVNPEDLAFSVGTAGGWWYYSNLSLSDIQPTTPGIPVTWEVVATNEGNADLTWTVTRDALTYAGGASNWSMDFIDSGGATTEIYMIIADNSEDSFSVRISPSAAENESPDGSIGGVIAYLDTGLPDASGPYLAPNGFWYSALGPGSSSISAEIQAPIMTLTRTMTIDAPGAYTGDPHDAVPGAIITFTIDYSNTGAGNASEVIIVDKVPNDSEGSHVNRTGALSGVTITAAQGTAVTWEVYYSTVASPDFTFGSFEGWTLLGTFEGEVPDFILTHEATYIKWEKDTVYPHEDSKTLTWGVTIN
jgi:uncharacterized repeat protein (TIGR01451 family)